jgi:hypothetical protein
MFSHRFLSVLANVVGALLAVKALIIAAMFVWSFLGEQPLMVFNPAAPLLNNVFLLAQELGIIFFFFVLSGTMNHFVSCCALQRSKLMQEEQIDR